MKNLNKIITIILLLFLVSCGDTEKTADEVINTGWDTFEAGSLQDALDSFNEALELDPNAIEAHVGKTFTLALMGQAQLSAAKLAAEAGLAIEENNADLLAALGFITSAQKSYVNSNASLLSAISADASWSFGHGIGLEVKDLHVTIAQNFVNLKNYESAKARMQVLNSAFNPDITTDEGLALLLAEIEGNNKSFL